MTGTRIDVATIVAAIAGGEKCARLSATPPTSPHICRRPSVRRREGPVDENFPLGLLRRLHADGLAAEHIITLGWRGAPDGRIRE